MSDATTPNEPQGNTITEPPEGSVTIPVTAPEPKPEPTPIDADLLKDPKVQAAVEEARRQEKAKMHSRMETMEAEIAAVRQEREQREAEEAAARQAAEEEARRLADEEKSVRELLERERQERLTMQTELQQTIEAERALFAREREYQEIQQYKAEAIAANDEFLMPELRDLIVGNTKEEIDASIALVAEKTSAILGQVQQQTLAERQAMRGVAPTGAPPVGPMEHESGQRVLTPDQIKAMGNDEYAQHREALLAAARAQGPYGR